MTATASDIAASFLGSCEDDKFHFIFFVVWCNKETDLQKTLICVDLEIVGAVFLGQQELCVWALCSDTLFLELLRRENYDCVWGLYTNSRCLFCLNLINISL